MRWNATSGVATAHQIEPSMSSRFIVSSMDGVRKTGLRYSTKNNVSRTGSKPLFRPLLFRAARRAVGGRLDQARFARSPALCAGAQQLCWRRGGGQSPPLLEEIPNGEFEDDWILAGESLQRDAPLEAERADRREPAEAEAGGDAQPFDHRSQAVVVAGIGLHEGVVALLAPLGFGVVGVADVEEHHSLDLHLREDRHLDLEVADELQVAADVDRAREVARIERGQLLHRRTEAEQVEAADGVDAADQVALVDGDALRGATDDVADVEVGAEYERSPDREIEARVAGEAHIGVLRGGIGVRDLRRGGHERALGREHAVVARVPVDRAAHRRRPALPEQVRERAEVHVQRRREAADDLPRLVRRDRHVLQFVRAEDARVVGDQISPRQIAAARGAIERRVIEERVVDREGEGDVRVEEIGIEEAQGEQLSQRRHLRLQRQRLPSSEEVVLRDLRLADEVLDGGEAGADLERARRPLGHFDVHLDLVVRAPPPRRKLHLVEEAERLHPPLREVEQCLVVQLAFVDPELAADDLVAGLVVAPDVDALEIDLLTLLDVEGEIDGLRVVLDRSERGDVDVGVALVLVEVVELDDVVAELAAIEGVARFDGQSLVVLSLGRDQVAFELELADAVLGTLFERDGDVEVLFVARQLDLRLSDLHVDVAAVVIERGQHQEIAIERLFLIGTG